MKSKWLVKCFEEAQEAEEWLNAMEETHNVDEERICPFWVETMTVHSDGWVWIIARLEQGGGKDGTGG